MISPSELDIQSTMENNGTCTEERERGKKINKIEEFCLFVAVFTIKVWFGGGFGCPQFLFLFFCLFFF
jgi:hypothetical protein